MFLKRLELHGFKSFAHKTAIDFLPGVTVVVGPNGCGKSNVLDAIRWVLGETSAKSLRGAKMGDVVFRGSSTLKPAHFSQINLIVGNEANWLKRDQTEVQVTRRLFSNGDSEYLINKQKGRMRDVHELFLDTGLGADGYSIIEQGQIGAMVAAKPAQRREIFEEAAGISRYKARREETLRKLVRTEEDLLRLFDIVSEVDRSVNSLYRQARKAARHRQFTRRLLRLQKRLLLRRSTLLKEKLALIEQNMAVARDAFEAASTTLAGAEAKRAENARLAENFQRELQELQQQRFDLQAAVNREQRRIESGRQTLEHISQRRALMDREAASSANRVQILQQTLSRLESDLNADRATLSGEEGGLTEKQRALESLRREHDEANGTLAKLRQELQADRHKEGKVLQDLRLSESLIGRFGQDLSEHDTLMARLKSEAEEAQFTADLAREELEQRRAKLKVLKEEWETLRAVTSTGDKEKHELAKSLDELSRRANQAASRVQALQDVEDSYEGFFKGVQVVMKGSQSGRLQGIYGVLTNVLTVPKQYETAVEVALGGSLQDIITLTERDASAAIDYLKRANAGRATFLPLDLLSQGGRADHLSEVLRKPGVIGLAKRLITYDPKIEPAVERRLGSAIVVDALQTATGLVRQGLRNRYVSMEGELVDPSGVMSGGSHQSRGFLSKAREIRQLRDEAEALEAKRKDVQSTLAAMTDKLSQAHARAAELQAELHRDQMSELRVDKDVQSFEQRAKDRRNALATAEARRIQQSLDLQKHEEVVANCRLALEEIQTVIGACEASVGAADGSFSERARLLASRAEEVSNNRAITTVLRERIRTLESKRNELMRDAASVETDQERRSSEAAALAAQDTAASDDIAAAELLLGDLIRQRDEMESRIGQLMQENEASVRQSREDANEVAIAQRDRNQRENSLRDVETQAAENRAQTEFLGEEVKNEFNTTIEAIAEELLGTATLETDVIVAPTGQQDAEADTSDEDQKQFQADELVTDPAELRRLVAELREKLNRLGPVNETAIDEYRTQKERLDFLTHQRQDLIAAKDALTQTIKDLDDTTKRLFHEAFTKIRENFQENFRRLFCGGKGDLILVEDEGHPEPGIDIFAQPPGKMIGGSITLMSGGEKAMTAICLTLALFQFKPSPICILDEIDAPLDEENIGRFTSVLRELSEGAQFMVITHSKKTMAIADSLFGVTMEEPGISKILSVRLGNLQPA